MLFAYLSSLWFALYTSMTQRDSLSDQHANLAKRVLQRYPLIDQHVDLPIVYRYLHGDDISHVDYNSALEGMVDLPRLRSGGSGGFFSIAFVPCYKSDNTSIDPIDLFLQPNNMVRDTLEQIDVTKQLALQYPEHVALATSTKEIRNNFKAKKITHLIGIEGAHSLGNSLAALRMYYDLGVRYLTLTHTCHNPFADTSGSTDNQEAKPLHGGLSKFGERLVYEMNRIGMMVDLSHTADDTARQAIKISKAPVIFSHSGSRGIFNHTRNLPDDILESISERTNKIDSFVGVPFLPGFINDLNPTIDDIANHVEHIAKIAGKSRVGIGSDFDGFFPPAIPGMEDVSCYHNLLQVLASRGWTEKESAGLTGGNFLRVFEKVEAVARDMAEKVIKADTVPWDARPDLKRVL